MPKKAKFELICSTPWCLAWRISGPHISTYENLHSKPKPVFSASLRAFLSPASGFVNLMRKVIPINPSWAFYTDAPSLAIIGSFLNSSVLICGSVIAF